MCLGSSEIHNKAFARGKLASLCQSQAACITVKSRVVFYRRPQHRWEPGSDTHTQVMVRQPQDGVMTTSGHGCPCTGSPPCSCLGYRLGAGDGYIVTVPGFGPWEMPQVSSCLWTQGGPLEQKPTTLHTQGLSHPCLRSLRVPGPLSCPPTHRPALPGGSKEERAALPGLRPRKVPAASPGLVPWPLAPIHHDTRTLSLREAPRVWGLQGL